VGAGKRRLARNLRRRLTPAERRLWHALKAHRFQDLHFRRQVPIGPYIADFICYGAKLVIEVDGEQHGFDRNATRDQERDRWSAGQGFRVLRFWNADVLKQIDSVLDTIYAHLPQAPELTA
jgi:very-short-patch-repair endonuclease